MLPDKRVTFDYFRPLSTLSDIIVTHLEEPTVHSLRSIIEFDCESVGNVNIFDHMKGTHGHRNIMDSPPVPNDDVILNKCVEDAMWRYAEAKGAYLDCHRWIWTDQWFHELIESLNKLGLLSLQIDMLYPTHEKSSEFYVIMSKKL